VAPEGAKALNLKRLRFCIVMAFFRVCFQATARGNAVTLYSLNYAQDGSYFIVSRRYLCCVCHSELLVVLFLHSLISKFKYCNTILKIRS